MDYIQVLHRQGAKAHAHFGWLVYIGTLNIILGILAVAFTGLSTLFAMLYLGWLLIFSGVASIYFAYRVRHLEGHWSFLILGLLTLVCGGFLLVNPQNDAVVFTLVVAILMFTSGLFSILSAFFTDAPHKGWVITNGVISIFCAIIIYNTWPFSGTWVPGTFLGVYLIFHGATQVRVGNAGQRFFSKKDKDKAKK